MEDKVGRLSDARIPIRWHAFDIQLLSDPVDDDAKLGGCVVIPFPPSHRQPIQSERSRRLLMMNSIRMTNACGLSNISSADQCAFMEESAGVKGKNLKVVCGLCTKWAQAPELISDFKVLLWRVLDHGDFHRKRIVGSSILGRFGVDMTRSASLSDA